MAVTYRIDSDERIIYLTTVGESSLAEWTEAMIAVLADPAYQSGFNFLSDRRQEANVPSTLFARGASDFLRSHRQEMGCFRWAAVSSNPAIYGMQRMFSILSEMQGINVEVFTDYEEAKRWLLVS